MIGNEAPERIRVISRVKVDKLEAEGNTLGLDLEHSAC